MQQYRPLIGLSSTYLLPYLQVQEKSLRMIFWCSAERNEVCYFYSYQGPRNYSLLCCYYSKSWGFGIRLSQQLAFQIPVGTIWEASKARGRPGFSSGFPEDPDTSCIPVRPREPSNRKMCLLVSPSRLWTSSEDLSRAVHRTRESRVGQDRF